MESLTDTDTVIGMTSMKANPWGCRLYTPNLGQAEGDWTCDLQHLPLIRSFEKMFTDLQIPADQSLPQLPGDRERLNP